MPATGSVSDYPELVAGIEAMNEIIKLGGDDAAPIKRHNPVFRAALRDAIVDAFPADAVIGPPRLWDMYFRLRPNESADAVEDRARTAGMKFATPEDVMAVVARQWAQADARAAGPGGAYVACEYKGPECRIRCAISKAMRRAWADPEDVAFSMVAVREQGGDGGDEKKDAEANADEDEDKKEEEEGEGEEMCLSAWQFLVAVAKDAEEVIIAKLDEEKIKLMEKEMSEKK